MILLLVTGSTLHNMSKAMKPVIALIDYTLSGNSFIHKDMGVRETYTRNKLLGYCIEALCI